MKRILLIFSIITYSITYSQGTIKVRKELPKVYFGSNYKWVNDTLYTADIQWAVLKIDTNYKILSFELSKVIEGNYISSGRITGKIDSKNHSTFIFYNTETSTKVESIKVFDKRNRKTLKLPSFYIRITYKKP